MSALLRWQQTWVTPGASSYLQYAEGWTESWALAAGDLVAAGHVAITGDFVMTIAFDMGSGTMATVGHAAPTTPGFDYPTEFVPSISGSVPAGGRTTITGALDFEEPIFLDPPLYIYPVGHIGLSATTTMLIAKAVGTGVMNQTGKVGFSTVSFGYQTAVIKQLFSVQLAVGGRTTLAGSFGSTSVKEIGAGLMAVGGRSTLSQTGLQAEAPAPYTHPIGSATLQLVGDLNSAGDITYSDVPATELGSLSIAMTGHHVLTTDRLFGGGLLVLPAMSLAIAGRTRLGSAFSYPGVEFPNTEAVAVYEGLDLQEVYADIEGGDVFVG